MAKPSPNQQVLLEEWKEARISVRRFDEYLLNLRRYGFTLATILIGADAYISMSLDVHPAAKTGAAAAVMLLIFALFLLDNHIKTLQSIALSRAIELENQLGLELSKLRQTITHKWQVTHGGTPTYILFLLVTGGLGIISVLTTTPPEEVMSLATFKFSPLAIVALLCLVLCVLTAGYDWWASKRLADIPFRTMRQIFRVRKRNKQT